MGTKVIFDSDGIHLRFLTNEDYRLYKNALEEIQVAAYKRTRDKYGIWAGNQNKFVNSVDELNSLDNKYMESLYSKYYPEEDEL